MMIWKMVYEQKHTERPITFETNTLTADDKIKSGFLSNKPYFKQQWNKLTTTANSTFQKSTASGHAHVRELQRVK